jgi:hypothetical protein
MKKNFSCGHKGLGKYCHRCELADLLEKLANEGKEYITSKGTDHPKKWTKQELLTEAKRLKASSKFISISSEG